MNLYMGGVDKALKYLPTLAQEMRSCFLSVLRTAHWSSSNKDKKVNFDILEGMIMQIKTNLLEYAKERWL